jgi:hypothetical protein
MLPEKPRCRPLPIALPQNRGDGRRKINRLSGAQFPRAEVRFPGTFFVQADKSSCGSTPQHSLFLDALFGNASRLRDGSDVFLAVESALGWAPSHQSFVLQLNGLPVFGEASLEYGVDGFSLIRRALFCQVLPADISECHGRRQRRDSCRRRWKRRRCRRRTSRGSAFCRHPRPGSVGHPVFFREDLSGRAASDRAMGIAFAPPVLRAAL